jgi:hypothetical protein
LGADKIKDERLKMKDSKAQRHIPIDASIVRHRGTSRLMRLRPEDLSGMKSSTISKALPIKTFPSGSQTGMKSSKISKDHG